MAGPCAGEVSVNSNFTNPILSGFHPDPSICRVGGDYYLVTSTFHFTPGVPIFHSRDLVNWRQIGHVLDRPSQLLMDNAEPSGGIFAPTLRYHDGVFYMITTNVSSRGNFVVTATDPAGPWSEPIWIEGAPGIDPSLFWDDDGRCYYTGNGDPETPLYDGHHTIWLQELDRETMQLTGERHIVVDGGTDISREPEWIEGPHLYKIDGRYYLIAAEGGTFEQHSVVVFRSDGVLGPYESFPGNPIVTNRSLDPARPHPITCTGHADLVETQTGEWWMVLLGCRPLSPYTDNSFATGRETFLVPMIWEDGWPVSRDGSGNVLRSYPKPELPEREWPDGYGLGSFGFRDDFEIPRLDRGWNFVRRPNPTGISLDARPGSLRLPCSEADIVGSGIPSFAGVRLRHADFSATTIVEFEPVSETESAGIAVMQNSISYLAMGIVSRDGARFVRLTLKTNDDPLARTVAEAPVAGGRIALRISATGNDYRFEYGVDGEALRTLADGVDGHAVDNKHGGWFVGAYVGLYAVSPGALSENHADFDWFEYAGVDPAEDIAP